MLGQAITATESMDHALIGEYIRSSEFDTVVGKVSFAANGEWAKTRVLMVQYQGVADNEVATFARAGTRVVLYPAGMEVRGHQLPLRRMIARRGAAGR